MSIRVTAVNKEYSAIYCRPRQRSARCTIVPELFFHAAVAARP